jgi:hypothetical protein
MYGEEHVRIEEGERLVEDHEIVRRYPQFFEPEETHRRREHLRSLAQDPRNCEAGAAFTGSTPSRTPDRGSQARDAGLRTIETYAQSGELRSDAADRLDTLVRRDDPLGLTARYMEAVGDDAYLRAFGKMVMDPQHGHLRFTPEEVAAVQRVTGATAQRAMAESVGSDRWLRGSLHVGRDDHADEQRGVEPGARAGPCHPDQHAGVARRDERGSDGGVRRGGD